MSKEIQDKENNIYLKQLKVLVLHFSKIENSSERQDLIKILQQIETKDIKYLLKLIKKINHIKQ